ncbi:MAG: hypothetical protein OHK0046_43200 [Anaerolineae bacterium]
MKKSLVEILALLRSANPHERALGHRFIGKTWCYAAAEHSITALRDAHEDVRASAAWALDQLGTPVAVPALLEALHDSVFSVRSNAGWALVHLAQRMMAELVVPDVIEVLSESDSYEARHMAYLVLYHIGGESAEDAIKRYWKH